MTLVNLIKNFNIWLKRLLKTIIASFIFKVSVVSGNLGENPSNSPASSSSIALSPQDEARLRDVSDLSLLQENRNFINEKLIESQELTKKLDRQTEIFLAGSDKEKIDNIILNSGASEENTETLSSAIFGVFEVIKKNKNHLSPVDSNTLNYKMYSSVSPNESSSVLTAISTKKPLGEMTLNEAFTKFLDLVDGPLGYLKENPQALAALGTVASYLGPLFVYKSLLVIVNSSIPLPKNISSLTFDQHRQLRRERQVILFVILPLLTCSLYAIKEPVAVALKQKGMNNFFKTQIEQFSESLLNRENPQNNSTGNIEEIPSSEFNNESEMSNLSDNGQNLSLLMFLGKNKYKILFVLICIFILALISKINDINYFYIIFDFITNPSPIVFKYFMLIFSLINLMFILRYIIFIVSIYLIKNNKLTKSVYKPSFLNNFIGKLENLSNTDNLNFIIDYFYRLMLIYTITFIFTSIIYYIL